MTKMIQALAVLFVLQCATFAQEAAKPAASAAAPAATYSAADREAAIKYLNETRDAFLKSIADLSDEQWKFKPAPEVWSIAEVSEHITKSEKLIGGMITTKVTAGTPVPEKKKVDNTPGDQAIVARISGRTQKAQAPEVLKPTNEWPNKEAVCTAFGAERAKNAEFVKSTALDLRSYFAPTPFGLELDAHQWVLFMSAHTKRHTDQIAEVKTLAGYPKQ